MSNKFFIVLILSLIFVTVGSANAGSVNINSSVHSYLSVFIPNSTLVNSSFISFKFDNNSYLFMNTTPTNHILINVTNGRYSFVTNVSSISKIISPLMIKLYYPNSTSIHDMKSNMSSYLDYSQPAIYNCKVDTGLNKYNFSIYNGGYSCESVPFCASDMKATGGVTGIVGDAISTFSAQDTEFNKSYTNFDSLLSNLNYSNFNTNINEMGSNLTQLDQISILMPQSALFPLPSNIPNSKLNACVATASAPYYCLSTGLCDEPLQFNFSYLDNIENTLNYLKMLPISGSKLNSFASNMSTLTESYIEPVIIKNETEHFDSFMNSTTGKYNKLNNSATSLLLKFNYPQLESNLTSMQLSYSYILSNGIHQNLTLDSNEFNKSFIDTNKSYSNAAKIYYNTYNKSVNNTGLIIFKELNYKNDPLDLVNLAFKQNSINNELANKVNNSTLTSISLEMAAIESNASNYSNPYTLPMFVKSFDSPFINAIVGNGNSLLLKDLEAPYFAALLSLIIGIIILLIIYYGTYYRLKKSKKIRVDKYVKRAWSILFIILFAIMLIYVDLTYSYAASANNFLPVYSFKNQFSSSNVTYVIYNSSSTSIYNCANAIKSLNRSKTVNLIAENGTSCTVNGNTYGDCLGYISKLSYPVIYLNSSGNSIVYKGLYGTILYANGKSASGKNCYTSEILN